MDAKACFVDDACPGTTFALHREMTSSATHGMQDDLMSSLLDAYRMRAHIYANPTLCGPWQLKLSGHRRVAFHLIGEGRCYLHLRDAGPRPLSAGDLVLFARDTWHMLSAEPTLDGTGSRVPDATGGSYTTLVCGEVEFVAGACNPVLDALPDVVLVTGADGGPSMEAVGRLLVSELNIDRRRLRIVVDKLADALFVMAVRHHVLRNSLDRSGVFAALADSRLQRALAAMHRDPGHAWTLESLAATAAMSRAAFAKRFVDVLGTTPMDYLTRWRMTQAELLLGQPRTSIADVASRMGYYSEAAFRRAFKRVRGISPGRLRRWLQATVPSSK